MDWQQRELTAAILQLDGKKGTGKRGLQVWGVAHESLILRWHTMVAELRASSVLNYTMFFVAIRELLDLTQMTMQSSENKICTGDD